MEKKTERDSHYSPTTCPKQGFTHRNSAMDPAPLGACEPDAAYWSGIF